MRGAEGGVGRTGKVEERRLEGRYELEQRIREGGEIEGKEKKEGEHR